MREDEREQKEMRPRKDRREKWDGEIGDKSGARAKRVNGNRQCEVRGFTFTAQSLFQFAFCWNTFAELRTASLQNLHCGWTWRAQAARDNARRKLGRKILLRIWITNLVSVFLLLERVRMGTACAHGARRQRATMRNTS